MAADETFVSCPETRTVPPGTAPCGLMDVIATETGAVGPACRALAGPAAAGPASPRRNAAASAQTATAIRVDRLMPTLRRSRGFRGCWRCAKEAWRKMLATPIWLPVRVRLPRTGLPSYLSLRAAHTLDARVRLHAHERAAAAGCGRAARHHLAVRRRVRAAICQPPARAGTGRRPGAGCFPRTAMWRPGPHYRRSAGAGDGDRKSTRLNSSHRCISYAVFCLKKKNH